MDKKRTASMAMGEMVALGSKNKQLRTSHSHASPHTTTPASAMANMSSAAKAYNRAVNQTRASQAHSASSSSTTSTSTSTPAAPTAPTLTLTASSMAWIDKQNQALQNPQLGRETVVSDMIPVIESMRSSSSVEQQQQQSLLCLSQLAQQHNTLLSHPSLLSPLLTLISSHSSATKWKPSSLSAPTVLLPVLSTAYQQHQAWPLEFITFVLQEARENKAWIDTEECSIFLNNVRSGMKDADASPVDQSSSEQQDTSSAVLPAVCNRYDTQLDAVRDRVFSVLAETSSHMLGPGIIATASQCLSLVRVCSQCIGYAAVRYGCSATLETLLHHHSNHSAVKTLLLRIHTRIEQTVSYIAASSTGLTQSMQLRQQYISLNTAQQQLPNTQTSPFTRDNLLYHSTLPLLDLHAFTMLFSFPWQSQWLEIVSEVVSRYLRSSSVFLLLALDRMATIDIRTTTISMINDYIQIINKAYAAHTTTTTTTTAATTSTTTHTSYASVLAAWMLSSHSTGTSNDLHRCLFLLRRCILIKPHHSLDAFAFCQHLLTFSTQASLAFNSILNTPVTEASDSKLRKEVMIHKIELMLQWCAWLSAMNVLDHSASQIKEWRLRMSSLQQQSLHWIHTFFPTYLPHLDTTQTYAHVCTLLFIHTSPAYFLSSLPTSTMYTEFNALDSNTMSRAAILCTERLPVKEETITTLALLSLRGRLQPIQGLSVLEVVMPRACALIKESTTLYLHEALVLKNTQLIEATYSLSVSKAASSPTTSTTATASSSGGSTPLAVTSLFWRASLQLLLCCACNIPTLGMYAWTKIPTLQHLLIMFITHSFHTFPPFPNAHTEQLLHTRLEDEQLRILSLADDAKQEPLMLLDTHHVLRPMTATTLSAIQQLHRDYDYLAQHMREQGGVWIHQLCNEQSMQCIQQWVSHVLPSDARILSRLSYSIQTHLMLHTMQSCCHFDHSSVSMQMRNRHSLLSLFKDSSFAYHDTVSLSPTNTTFLQALPASFVRIRALLPDAEHVNKQESKESTAHPSQLQQQHAGALMEVLQIMLQYVIHSYDTNTEDEVKHMTAMHALHYWLCPVPIPASFLPSSSSSAPSAVLTLCTASHNGCCWLGYFSDRRESQPSSSSSSSLSAGVLDKAVFESISSHLFQALYTEQQVQTVIAYLSYLAYSSTSISASASASQLSAIRLGLHVSALLLHRPLLMQQLLLDTKAYTLILTIMSHAWTSVEQLQSDRSMAFKIQIVTQMDAAAAAGEQLSLITLHRPWLAEEHQVLHHLPLLLLDGIRQLLTHPRQSDSTTMFEELFSVLGSVNTTSLTQHQVADINSMTNGSEPINAETIAWLCTMAPYYLKDKEADKCPVLTGDSAAQIVVQIYNDSKLTGHSQQMSTMIMMLLGYHVVDFNSIRLLLCCLALPLPMVRLLLYNADLVVHPGSSSDDIHADISSLYCVKWLLEQQQHRIRLARTTETSDSKEIEGTSCLQQIQRLISARVDETQGTETHSMEVAFNEATIVSS